MTPKTWMNASRPSRTGGTEKPIAAVIVADAASATRSREASSTRRIRKSTL